MTQLLTSTHLRRLPLGDDDRLALAARSEEYLTWRHVGVPAPRSAAEMAERIGWQAHTVIRHCENIKNRYIRSGPRDCAGRALEELARLLVSAGTLAADDLRRLPPTAAWAGGCLVNRRPSGCIRRGGRGSVSTDRWGSLPTARLLGMAPHGLVAWPYVHTGARSIAAARPGWAAWGETR
jgi:hypothetical protein